MTIDIEKLTNELITGFEMIHSEDIPNIPLYMDQVTTFMDEHLASQKRYEEDKVLTKTMINNYAKNDLLPSPEKKRYTKEHVLVLTFIYYFKSILSINDIKTVLTRITENYFASTGQIHMEDIYNEINRIQEEDIENVKKDVKHKATLAMDSFPDLPKKDRDFLQQFSMICLLSFDIYTKKQLMENMIDALSKEIQESEPAKDKKKKKKE